MKKKKTRTSRSGILTTYYPGPDLRHIFFRSFTIMARAVVLSLQVAHTLRRISWQLTAAPILIFPHIIKNVLRVTLNATIRVRPGFIWHVVVGVMSPGAHTRVV